jgi:hypothetical protein
MGLPNQALADSLNAIGAAAAPTANTSIASFGVLAAGVYRVTGTLMNTGTQETTVSSLYNFKLLNGSSSVGQFICVAQPIPFVIERVTMTGSSSLRIVPNSNAVAGSVYVVQMIATKVG